MARLNTESSRNPVVTPLSLELGTTDTIAEKLLAVRYSALSPEFVTAGAPRVASSASVGA